MVCLASSPLHSRLYPSGGGWVSVSSSDAIGGALLSTMG